MSVKTNKITLSTTAVELTGSDEDRSEREPLSGGGYASAITLRADVAFYVGGSDVTTANGWLVDADEVAMFELWSSEKVFAVLASGVGTVSVLRTGV